MVSVSHGISSLLKAILLIQVSKSHMRRGLVMKAGAVEDLQEMAARAAAVAMVMVVAVAAAAAEASPAGCEVTLAATTRIRSLVDCLGDLLSAIEVCVAVSTFRRRKFSACRGNNVRRAFSFLMSTKTAYWGVLGER